MTDASPSSTEPQAIAPSNAGIEAPPVELDSGTPGAIASDIAPSAPVNALQANEATLELLPSTPSPELNVNFQSMQRDESPSEVDPAREVLAKIVGILHRDFNIFSGELKAALEEADKVL